MAGTTFIPTGDPHVRRRFQLTNFGGNNKYYLVETWPMPGGEVFLRSSYGRVGAAPQLKERVASEQYVAGVIRKSWAKAPARSSCTAPTRQW